MLLVKILFAFVVLLVATETTILRKTCLKWGIFRLISTNLRVTVRPIQSHDVHLDLSCIVKCMDHPNCKAINTYAQISGKTKCYLFDQDQNSNKLSYSFEANAHYYDTGPLQEKVGPYCKSMSNNPCGKKRCFDSCSADNITCVPYQGFSCKHIQTKYWSINLTSDFYTIVYDDKKVRVYCDMVTDGGGWMLIGHVKANISTPVDDLETKEIYNSNSLLSMPNFILKRATLEVLRGNPGFSQIRFYCRKYKKNITVHAVTASNTTGYAVVDYLSNIRNEAPEACGSYYVMADDNSHLTRECWKWGDSNNLNKWSSKRLSKFPMVIWPNHFMGFRLKGPVCDDQVTSRSSSDDGIWKYYIR